MTATLRLFRSALILRTTNGSHLQLLVYKYGVHHWHVQFFNSNSLISTLLLGLVLLSPSQNYDLFSSKQVAVPPLQEVNIIHLTNQHTRYRDDKQCTGDYSGARTSYFKFTSIGLIIMFYSGIWLKGELFCAATFREPFYQKPALLRFKLTI